ncbi:DUF3105 domain-containing protein [Candidatus Gottesmanbacteria bacterium]|nr:DUF3105 domain-containing protein [Candidatus Gottesmanbacteria bacterium]
MQWWKVIIGAVIIGALGWFGWYVTRPVPGIRTDEQGREHVTPEAVAAFAYNSNPPTSGPHLPTWVKAGVFDRPQSEGELIHALEHGYVIMSYNCNVHLQTQNSKLKTQKYNANLKTFLSQNVFAHEEGGPPPEASVSAVFNVPSEATASAVNESEGCTGLVKQLTELANKKKIWKLIVVPRPQLDTTIALTAWTYLDTFDQFDEKRITRFIDYHRDQGPEKTME